MSTIRIWAVNSDHDAKSCVTELADQTCGRKILNRFATWTSIYPNSRPKGILGSKREILERCTEEGNSALPQSR